MESRELQRISSSLTVIGIMLMWIACLYTVTVLNSLFGVNQPPSGRSLDPIHVKLEAGRYLDPVHVKLETGKYLDPIHVKIDK